MKIAQYPRNSDGTPMNLEVGVLTDTSGNGGARLVSTPVGPDDAPIDVEGLVLVDMNGNLVVPLTVSDIGGSVREVLLADRTYYVRTDGNDANTGLLNTAAGAKATIQAAVDAAYKLDCNGYKVIINVGAGAYADSVTVTGRMFGARDNQRQILQIIGDEVTPGNVVVTVNGTALNVTDNSYCLVAGITWGTTAGVGWQVLDGAILEHRNCVFNSTTDEMIVAHNFATVRAIGPLTVNGNGDSFVHCTRKAIVSFTSQTITFNGNIFAVYLWGINDATVMLDNATINGTRPNGGITVHGNALLNTGSMIGNYLGGQAPVVSDNSEISGGNYNLRTFYVRPDGNDNNDGLVNSPDRAFVTVQAAVDFLSSLDFREEMWTTASGGVVIQIADGTYAGFLLRDMKHQTVSIVGNIANPANVVINGAADGIGALGTHTQWIINGMEITAAGGSCLRAEKGASIDFQNIIFGSASNFHISTAWGARIVAVGNYSVIGGAQCHVQALNGSVVDLSTRTVTLTGVPAFSAAFLRAFDGSMVNATSVTWTGTATGTKFDVKSGGYVDAADITTLPGNADGSWLGNKPDAARTLEVVSAATVTPTTNIDQVNITAQAVALLIANATGTAVKGRRLTVRIKDNGSAQALSFGSLYRNMGVTKPTTTVAGKTMYLHFIYNSADNKYDLIMINQEA